jgi:hypothetical protein
MQQGHKWQIIIIIIIIIIIDYQFVSLNIA